MSANAETMDHDNPATRERRFIVRTGIFVSLALLLAMLVIALIGNERQLFTTKTTFRIELESVDGLSVDSPVWLGGLEVGRVKAIRLSPDLNERRIEVLVEIGEKFVSRVRDDSVARVTSRGVLGDKVIDISIGSAQARALQPGEQLRAGTGGDISALLNEGAEVMDNAVAISRDLRRAVSLYAQPELAENVAGTLRSVHRIVSEVEKGDGALHALLFDPATKKDLQVLLGGAARTAQRLDGAVQEAERILHDVRTGQGAFHALIYDKRTGQAFADLGEAAGELAGLIQDAKKSPNGAVHQLIYGDSGAMISDLGAMAADLRQVVAKVRAGEGSLGAMINDPTIYEDLKTILGNVKRNRILRALVRYSISNADELRRTGEVKRAPVPPASSTGARP